MYCKKFPTTGDIAEEISFFVTVKKGIYKTKKHRYNS